MADLISWLVSHAVVILSVLLGISEALALIFPPQSGVAGFLQAAIKFLKSLGAKEPQ